MIHSVKNEVSREGRHITTNGVRLHYIDLVARGQTTAQTIILIPGITSPAITWEFVGARLAASSRVIIIDNRGRGLSSGGIELTHGLEDYARDTAGLIEQLNIQSPIILGHSMGARIAFKFGAMFPDMVGKIIAADPPVTGPGRRPYPIPLEWYLEGIDAASRGDPEDTSSPILKNWSHEQLSLRAEWLPTCDKTAIAGSHASFHKEDIHSLLPQIECPVLLIYAENGNTVLDGDAKEIVEATHNCSAIKIEGVGHMIPWDDLDAFITATESFL